MGEFHNAKHDGCPTPDPKEPLKIQLCCLVLKPFFFLLDLIGYAIHADFTATLNLNSGSVLIHLNRAFIS